MQRSFVTPPAVVVLAVLTAFAALAAGCALRSGASPMSSASLAEASATVSETPATASEAPVGSGSVRPSLPPGFPVFPGASLVPLPDDDPGLIAAWTSEQLGSAAYDFYVAALPEAGYVIEGLYPGGDFAAIRFRVADGALWQLIVHGAVGGPMELEVRLDRP